jgi:hypothetical protein
LGFSSTLAAKHVEGMRYPADSVPAFMVAEPADVVFLGDAVVCVRDVVAHFDAVDVCASPAGF